MVKILIVEDDAMIREAFTIILKLHPDYDVTTAENGLIALQLCKDAVYDIILLDIMMPVMDGPTFLTEYSTGNVLDLTKIIIMSNLSSGSELSLIQDLGVDNFVLKSSLTPQRLMTIVADVLKEQTQLRDTLKAASSSHPSHEADAPEAADQQS